MSEIKNTLNGLRKSITKSSNEIIKTTKINMKISSEEEKLNQLYKETGKKVHEIYMYGGSLGTVFDEKYNEMLVSQHKINELRLKLKNLKSKNFCDKCGNEVDYDESICIYCKNLNINSEDGNYFIPEVTKNTIVVKQIDSKEKKICPSCYAENEINFNFCLSCGRQLKRL